MSVLHTHAMAWNSEVALQRKGGSSARARRHQPSAACQAAASLLWRQAQDQRWPGWGDTHTSPRKQSRNATRPGAVSTQYPPGAGEEHEEPEDEEAPGVVKAHRPVDDEGPQSGVQQRVGQAEHKGGNRKGPALQKRRGRVQGKGGQGVGRSVRQSVLRRTGCLRVQMGPYQRSTGTALGASTAQTTAHRVEAHLALLPEYRKPRGEQVHLHRAANEHVD